MTVHQADTELWTERLLGVEPGPVSHEGYTSREMFERERAAIFDRVWMYVGRVEQVAKPGSYFTREIEVCKTSVIVVRGMDGQLRAFHNLCSHRGARLVYGEDPRIETAGKCRKFVCKFHGWQYSLDGELDHITFEENFPGIEKSQLGLVPVSVDVWNGFLFVNMDPNPDRSLADFLGPIGAEIEDYPFEEMPQAYGYRSVVKANWKIAIDPTQESYHFAFLHAKLQTEMAESAARVAPVFFRVEGDHRQMSLEQIPADVDQQTPVEKLFGGNLYGRAGDGDEGGYSNVKGLNPGNCPNWGLDDVEFFPNFGIAIFERGRFQTMSWWPIDENSVLFEVIAYFRKPRNASERFAQEMTAFAAQEYTPQDLNMVEGQHLGLRSGARSHFQYAEQEVLCRHSHNVIASYLSGNRRQPALAERDK